MYQKKIERFTRERALTTENPGHIAEMEAVFLTSSMQGIQHHFICFTVDTIKHYEMPSLEIFSLLNGLEQMRVWGRLLATSHREGTAVLVRHKRVTVQVCHMTTLKDPGKR